MSRMVPPAGRAALGLLPLFLLGAGGGASSGEGDGGVAGETGTVVALVLFVGFAYLLADVVVDRLQRRFLVLSGVEYLLLGALLGPVLGDPLGVALLEDFRPLVPLAALAAGWFGLLRGLDSDLRRVQRRRQTGALRIAAVETAASGVATAVLAWLALRPGGPLARGLYGLADPVDGLDRWATVAAAVFLGACAATASTEPLMVLRRRYDLGRNISPMVRRTAHLSEIFAIVTTGLFVCAVHPSGGRDLRPTEWAVISIGLGIVLGFLFRPFVGEGQSEGRRFLALVGVITFASGASLFLRLSPLLVNLVLGAVLALSPRSRTQLRATLERTEGPMNLVLMVFAGALWRPPTLTGTAPWLLPALVGSAVLVFVAVRYLGKRLGDRLGTAGTSLPQDLHRGLLGQGSFTVAIAVLLRTYYEGPAVDWAYTVILGSFVCYSLVSTRMLRGLLVDGRDIERDALRSRPPPPRSPSSPVGAAGR